MPDSPAEARPDVAPIAAPDFDVLVVGAGLSGVGAGCHLQARCPGLGYAILEAREAIGGTWDLFRYPGVRSDSDMHTLGYSFQPWRGAKAIADGSSILAYVRQTAAEHGVDRRVRFRHRVRRASWSSAEARWTVEAERTDTGDAARLTCGVLLMCSGYYSYAEGHAPDFPGADRFKGRVVHPQFWPEDLDHAGKRVVVVGSGATAVTLVPAMAEAAAHVTMLQRSPTYVVPLPAEDKIADWLRRRLPAEHVHRIARWKNVALGAFFYRLARRRPERTKRRILAMAQRALGPGQDAAAHFTPRYDPWDQRLCVAPDADMFEAMRSGRASVLTDHIEAFTETGIRLRSGAELGADIVVTATGLKLNLLGDVVFEVDAAASSCRKPWPTRARCSAACRTSPRCSATRTRPGRSRPTSSASTFAGCSTTCGGAVTRPWCRAAILLSGRSLSSTSPRATSSARCTCSPSRGRRGLGSSARTTPWTCWRSVSAP